MNEKTPRSGLFLRLQEYLSLGFFSVMCLLMVLQLASRYVFSRPILWTEEFSRFCYVWVAFLGLAIAHRRRDHIRINLFTDMLPAGVQKILNAAIAFASIAILVYIGYWGVEYMIFNEWSVAASVDFPLYYVYAALPFGCLLGIANIIWNAFSPAPPVQE